MRALRSTENHAAPQPAWCKFKHSSRVKSFPTLTGRFAVSCSLTPLGPKHAQVWGCLARIYREPALIVVRSAHFACISLHSLRAWMWPFVAATRWFRVRQVSAAWSGPSVRWIYPPPTDLTERIPLVMFASCCRRCAAHAHLALLVFAQVQVGVGCGGTPPAGSYTPKVCRRLCCGVSALGTLQHTTSTLPEERVAREALPSFPLALST